MDKIYNRLTIVYFTLLIIYIQIVNVLYCYQIIDSNVVSTGLIYIGIVGLIMYFLHKFIDKNIKVHDIFIIMMTLLGILSWKNAYVQRVALIGFKSGREGLLVIITYYISFLLATTIKEKKYKKYILNLMTITGIMNVLYSYMQIPGKSYIFNIPIADIWGYPSGFLSNSNFYGSYMVIITGIWLANYLFGQEKNKSYISLIIVLLFISGLFISGAMSAILAFIFMFILTIIISIYLYKKDKNNKNDKKNILKKYSILIVLTIMIYTIISLTTNINLNKDIKEVGEQITSAATTGIDESFGTGRIHIWKEAIKRFKEYDYWITGIGIDNFYYLGRKEAIIDIVSGDVIYKAHNEYLQILITEGIFMLITYLIFLLFILLKAMLYFIKSKQKEMLFISLLIAFIGYLIQAFFNISMTRVAPLFFIIGGLLSEYGDKIFEQ